MKIKVTLIHTFMSCTGKMIYDFGRGTQTHSYKPGQASRDRLHTILRGIQVSGEVHLQPALNGGYFAFIDEPVTESEA